MIPRLVRANILYSLTEKVLSQVSQQVFFQVEEHVRDQIPDLIWDQSWLIRWMGFGESLPSTEHIRVNDEVREAISERAHIQIRDSGVRPHSWCEAWGSIMVKIHPLVWGSFCRHISDSVKDTTQE